MRNASISRKEKRKKIIPMEYYFANILLTFYFLGLGPSNIDFPPQSTSEINMVSFFQFPVPPCYQPWLVKYVRSSLMQLICISKVNGCWSQTQRVLVMRQGLRMKVIGWMRTEFYFFYLNYIY